MPSWFCVPVSSRSGRVVRGGQQLRDIERLEEVAAAVQHADVRPVELVGRAGQQIAAEGGHVNEHVRRIVHRIDEQQPSARVDEIARAAHVGDRAKRVRGGADRHQPGARADEPFEIAPVELPGPGDHARCADGHAAIASQRLPGRHVGVMIELRDNDFVARPP